MSDELKLWAYARSSSPRPGGLIRQMEGLLADAGRNGWQVVGASQDMSTGKTLARMGLREAQRAIWMKQANGILVESVGKISHEYYTALRVLELLQDHSAVLICTQTDISYELHIKGLSQALWQRAAQKGLGLPWQIEVTALPKAIEQPEMIEREYGQYRAKIYFARENIPDADDKILDTIMQSYRQRIARES